VTPIVAKVKDPWNTENFFRDYPWKFNLNEVDKAFGMPLDAFLQPPRFIQELFWSGEKFFMREYDYHDEESGMKFSITGLTAHIAHEVASVACASDSGSISTAMNSIDKALNRGSILWKQNTSSRGRIYWTKRFFVCSSVDSTSWMLHHYDNEEQAQRKAQTATKKNRLPLKGSTVKLLEDTPFSIDREEKYGFIISALGGRIKWHLASRTEHERAAWIHLLRERNM
jgi:hypothetical protein